MTLTAEYLEAEEIIIFPTAYGDAEFDLASAARSEVVTQMGKL